VDGFRFEVFEVMEQARCPEAGEIEQILYSDGEEAS
jgi:hypothetical protein